MPELVCSAQSCVYNNATLRHVDDSPYRQVIPAILNRL